MARRRFVVVIAGALVCAAGGSARGQSDSSGALPPDAADSSGRFGNPDANGVDNGQTVPAPPPVGSSPGTTVGPGNQPVVRGTPAGNANGPAPDGHDEGRPDGGREQQGGTVGNSGAAGGTQIGAPTDHVGRGSTANPGGTRPQP